MQQYVPIAGNAGVESPGLDYCCHGTKVTGKAFDQWSYQRGVRVHCIRSGKPIGNCFIESFNGTFRDDCLNEHWFMSLDDA